MISLVYYYKNIINYNSTFCFSILSKFIENSFKMASQDAKFKEIITSIEFGNIYMVRMNRPKKLNALNSQVNFGDLSL